MAPWDSASASRKWSSVSREKTTPQPKVSSGRLRSTTRTRVSGNAFRMRMEK